MKPLTLEETKLKEEMKQRCLIKGQYTDKNAKNKFKMLCHLEDFEIQYWELLEENKKLKKRIEYLERSNNRREDIILEQKQDINDLEDNWNKLKEYIMSDINNRKDYEVVKTRLIGGKILIKSSAFQLIQNKSETMKEVLDKMQKLERSDDNE